MEDQEKITIGLVQLIKKDYADKFWIYGKGGEGAALNDEDLKKLEQLLLGFLKEIM